MHVTASKLRQNIYKLLDRVLETGEPLEIMRKGALLQIVPLKRKQKIKKLKRREIMACEPDSIVHMDWSDQWKA